MLPREAKLNERFQQRRLNRCYVAPGEPVVLTQLGGPARTVQIKHGLTTLPNDVNVSGAVVIEIDDHAEARKSEDRGHASYSSIFLSA